MKIDRIDVSTYSIPLTHPMSDSSHGVIDSFTLVTAGVRTDDGLSGLGYSYTVGTKGGKAIASLIRDDLAPILKGKDPRCVAALWQEMQRGIHYFGPGGATSFAISAIDIALWDLKAKALREPLWRMLGGNNPQVQAYASEIDLQQPVAVLEERARYNFGRGLRAIKMKVGRERLSEDLMRVRTLRDLLGPEGQLMVDANTAWSVSEALRASRALAEYDVYWLEEPTAEDDVQGYARIQREAPLPVAAGENWHTLGEFEAMISAGGVSFPEPDATNCGGVSGWLKVAHLAEAHRLPVTSHGAHDLHVSLLAAVPNASFLEIHGFGLDSFLVNPVRLSGGFALASERPGHGIEFRWDELRRFATD